MRRFVLCFLLLAAARGFSQTVPADMISPTANSQLGGATQTFTWTAGTNVTSYWIWIGTVSGAANIYDASQDTNTSVNISGLPTAGERIYVRLFSLIDGAWQWHDYNYLAYGGAQPQPAAMVSPASGSELPGDTQTFTWTTGSYVDGYWMWIGTAPGAADLFDSSLEQNTSATVTGLPTGSGNVYVRLLSSINGAWQWFDYVYLKYGTPIAAQMIAPAPNSTLPSPVATFSWTTGTFVAQYQLLVGTQPGMADIYSSAPGQNLSATVSGLPISSSPVYVRLISVANGTSQWQDYLYTAASSAALGQLVTISGTPHQVVASVDAANNVALSLPTDFIAFPWTSLFTVGPPPNDSVTSNTVPARVVIKNYGIEDPLHGQDILRLYADYSGSDDRPSVRVDAGGHLHITRVVTLSGTPNDIYSEMGGQYMLGIASDTPPEDPLLVLKPNGPNTATVDFTNQPLIVGYGAEGQHSFALQASGKMGLGTATPVVSGTGKFHQSGDTIRIIDQLRTPASATETCNQGEVTFDASFLYVCVADNTWKKAALSSF